MSEQNEDKNHLGLLTQLLGSEVLSVENYISRVDENMHINVNLVHMMKDGVHGVLPILIMPLCINSLSGQNAVQALLSTGVDGLAQSVTRRDDPSVKPN